MKKFLKRTIGIALSMTLVASLAACGTKASDANADAGSQEPAAVDFSKESVTAIVPYDAGGGTDTVMRALADAAKGSFKNITVENRSGAGGATGMLAGANAAADGKTITMTTVELTTLEAMGTNAGLTYSQFKPIMMVNSAASAITVKADDTRFNTLEDVLEYSKSNGFQMGNSGNGAIWHLAAAGLAKAADTHWLRRCCRCNYGLVGRTY